jgi:hypothetical protein
MGQLTEQVRRLSPAAVAGAEQLEREPGALKAPKPGTATFIDPEPGEDPAV